MSATRISVVDYHTGGEPFRIVTGGVPPVEGATILERRRFAHERLDRYRRLLGSPGDLNPTVLASWAGSDQPGASLNGGVLKGLVLMRMSGRAALQPSPPLRALAYRYVAHESAHFWLGQLLDDAED